MGKKVYEDGDGQPRDRVERTERFVQQEQRRIVYERPADGDPLPRATSGDRPAHDLDWKEHAGEALRHDDCGDSALIANFICACRGGADTVLCDEKFLMENGNVITIDEPKALKEVQTRGERIATASDLWKKVQPLWPIVS